MKKFICAVSILAIAVISGSNAIGKKGIIGTEDLKDVAKSLIEMKFGSGPNGPFQVKQSKEKDATLIIQNDTDRTIIVTAKGPATKKFTVDKGKSDKAVVAPGKYNFVAEAQGTSGCQGDAELKGFNEYTWVFVIKK